MTVFFFMKNCYLVEKCTKALQKKKEELQGFDI